MSLSEHSDGLFCFPEIFLIWSRIEDKNGQFFIWEVEKMGKGQKAWFEQVAHSLDPVLVHELRRLREHDDDKATVPVIVRLKKDLENEKKEHLLQLCQEGECNAVHGELELVHGLYGNLHPETIRQLVEHEAVDRIFHDREVRAFLDVATRSIGSRDVQAKLEYTGKGVTIAIVDTGIYPHADLTRPKNRILKFVDLVNGKTEPYDDQGHGTHCAGDAAGNGYQSEGLYTAPAPEANLVGVKVLDGNGSGQLSTVIRGIEWCVKNKQKYNIRVLSLSLGAPAFESYRDDPVAQAVEKAWHSGIVVCAAAGNEGPYPMTISTPGLDPMIITVGAADDHNTVTRGDDEKASFSSRGPTIDQLVKPDVYAPGTDIVSLSAPGSQLEKQLPENRVGEHYIRLSGTSMATPICAGVVAQLLEANPYLSPNDVKSILMSTSQEMSGDQAGYLDVRKAVALAKKYLEFQKPTVSHM